MFSWYPFSDNFLFWFFVYHWLNSLYCELLFEMSNIEYRKQPHICLCLVLFLVVVVDNAHIPRRKRSVPFTLSDLLFRLVQSGQTAGLGAAASLVWFFLFSFSRRSWAFTHGQLLYTHTSIHIYTIPTTNYSVRLYTIHAREIPPRPYKPFSFFFSCVATHTHCVFGSQSRAGCQLLRMRVISSVVFSFALF